MSPEDDRIESGVGRITHECSYFSNRKSAFTLLLRYCVIRAFQRWLKRSDNLLQHVSKIQSRYQRSCFRLIELFEADPKKATYMANCRPCGLNAKPKTTFCRNPEVCPWCLVRQWLMPAYNALRAVPKKKRRELQIAVWSFPFQNHGDPCPVILSSRRQSPAAKLKAVAGVYVAAIRGMLAPEDEKRFLRNKYWPGSDYFYTQWVGITILPKSVDAGAVLRQVSPDITLHEVGMPVTDHNIMIMFDRYLRYPGLLLQYRNVDSFNRLLQPKKGKSRSLRIQKYKENS